MHVFDQDDDEIISYGRLMVSGVVKTVNTALAPDDNYFTDIIDKRLKMTEDETTNSVSQIMATFVINIMDTTITTEDIKITEDDITNYVNVILSTPDFNYIKEIPRYRKILMDVSRKWLEILVNMEVIMRDYQINSTNSNILELKKLLTNYDVLTEKININPNNIPELKKLLTNLHGINKKFNEKTKSKGKKKKYLRF